MEFSPFGLSPISNFSQGINQGQICQFDIKNAFTDSIYQNSVVRLQSVDSTLTAVADNANTNTILGVFQSVNYQPINSTSMVTNFNYWAKNSITQDGKNPIASVIIDPFAKYLVQAKGTFGTNPVGKIVFLVNNLTGDNGTGQSRASATTVPDTAVQNNKINLYVHGFSDCTVADTNPILIVSLAQSIFAPMSPTVIS